jgi:hypothetical protein
LIVVFNTGRASSLGSLRIIIPEENDIAVGEN